MKELTIALSDSSIRKAISELEAMIEDLSQDTCEIVDDLLLEGTDAANSAYGRMAHATGTRDSEGNGIAEGHIGVSAEDEDAAIIAEFGAGYATMVNHPMADNAPVPIEVASYSKEHQGMFYETDQQNPGHGFWVFGGKPYREVQARHGLLDARDRIVERAADIAAEVIQRD